MCWLKKNHNINLELTPASISGKISLSVSMKRKRCCTGTMCDIDGGWSSFSVDHFWNLLAATPDKKTKNHKNKPEHHFLLRAAFQVAQFCCWVRLSLRLFSSKQTGSFTFSVNLNGSIPLQPVWWPLGPSPLFCAFTFRRRVSWLSSRRRDKAWVTPQAKACQRSLQTFSRVYVFKCKCLQNFCLINKDINLSTTTDSWQPSGTTSGICAWGSGVAFWCETFQPLSLIPGNKHVVLSQKRLKFLYCHIKKLQIITRERLKTSNLCCFRSIVGWRHCRWS